MQPLAFTAEHFDIRFSLQELYAIQGALRDNSGSHRSKGDIALADAILELIEDAIGPVEDRDA